MFKVHDKAIHLRSYLVNERDRVDAVALLKSLLASRPCKGEAPTRASESATTIVTRKELPNHQQNRTARL